jgi:hypothetical protein
VDLDRSIPRRCAPDTYEWLPGPLLDFGTGLALAQGRIDRARLPERRLQAGEIMDTLADAFEKVVPEQGAPAKQPSSPEVDVNWHDSTSESHPGVSIESWRRARGWTTED